MNIAATVMKPKYLSRVVSYCTVVEETGKTYIVAHLQPSRESTSWSALVELVEAMMDAATPTSATTTRRPENSEIMLNASNGRRMAVEAMMMVVKIGFAVDVEAMRGVREIRSLE